MQTKFYVAEPSQYPIVTKFDFKKSAEERKELNDLKKLFCLNMLNTFGIGWRKNKLAKPKTLTQAYPVETV